MNNLTDIIQSIQQLNPDELNQVEYAIHERRQALSYHKVKDPEKLLAIIDDVFDNFWEGVRPEKIDEAIQAMNGKSY